MNTNFGITLDTNREIKLILILEAEIIKFINFITFF